MGPAHIIPRITCSSKFAQTEGIDWLVALSGRKAELRAKNIERIEAIEEC